AANRSVMTRMKQIRIRVAWLLLGYIIPLSMASRGTAMTEKTFAPDNHEVFTNPERGFYRQYTAQSESHALTCDKLEVLQDHHISLMLRMYYLKSFRDRPLSESQLNIIRADFAVMRGAGVKCILRFAYAQRIGEPDAPLSVVLGHLEQLGPILHENVDVIAVVQAGLIGTWGEWHTSTNQLSKPASARRIAHKWLEVLPAQRAIQVRTPRQKWMILGDKTPLNTQSAWKTTSAARIGHHNDCFLSSADDVGTYVDAPNEKPYLHAETRYVPMGGETCAKVTYSEPDNARTDMSQLHFSYLNQFYHGDVIAHWRDCGFYDEVQRRLGYRLALNSIRYVETVKRGDALPVTLTLSNTGFAAPFNPRPVKLILTPTDGATELILPIDADPRTWLAGEPILIDVELPIPRETPPGYYGLLLALPDASPSLATRAPYAIRLANPGMWNPSTGRHDLGVTIRVRE
ncbi:DUF4832 domain-containing protein, partial [Pirellulales bacterium]|nr:DUF4832 domain-containing protein [Pirellulales bacterium]